MGNGSKTPKGCQWWLALMIICLVAACAPAISPQLRQQVDRGLSFAQLTADPDSYRGKMVLLGGVIVQTVPKPGVTEIEILQKPLDYWDEPVDGDRSGGRFLVQAEGFHDPAIYRADRKITVVGEVAGSEVRKLEALDYRYPVIQAKAVKLWPRPFPSPPPGYPGYYRWDWPYYWGPWWFGPYWWP